MARTPEEKKAAQAIAHRKWRNSPKGKAYAIKKRLETTKPEPLKPNDQAR